MKYYLAAFMVLCCFLGGCAKGTTVVLLDDPDGRTGKIRVSSATGEQQLDTAHQSTQVSKTTAAPSKPKIMDQEKIDTTFGPALSALPAQSEQFLLYFEHGTTILTPESKLLPARVLATVQERHSTDVRVNGHTDRVGASDRNMRLSHDRAMLIHDYLVNAGIHPDIISVFAHGEGNPLIPTEDDVAEPKNRRVEVLVR